MKSNIRKSRLVAVAFGAVTLSSAIPSAASPDEEALELLAGEEIVDAKVFHGDLNLATEAGVKVLDRRLDGAVRRLCGSPRWSMGAVSPRTDRCRQAAQASIAPQRRIAIARAGERNGAFAAAQKTAGDQLAAALAE